MRKKIIGGNELQYDPLLHSHLWFPKAAGKNRWVIKNKLHVSSACSSGTYCADYLHLCFKNTGC